MSIVTNKVVRMVFSTTNGKTLSLSFPGPKADLSAAQVGQVMELMIARNIIETDGGDLTSKRDIKIVETTTEDLFDVPGA